ncbi:hypothetical protein BIFADO_01894, partial [Bifidobacterium adolescentis L2-32]
ARAGLPSPRRPAQGQRQGFGPAGVVSDPQLPGDQPDRPGGVPAGRHRQRAEAVLCHGDPRSGLPRRRPGVRQPQHRLDESQPRRAAALHRRDHRKAQAAAAGQAGQQRAVRADDEQPLDQLAQARRGRQPDRVGGDQPHRRHLPGRDERGDHARQQLQPRGRELLGQEGAGQRGAGEEDLARRRRDRQAGLLAERRPARVQAAPDHRRGPRRGDPAHAADPAHVRDPLQRPALHRRTHPGQHLVAAGIPRRAQQRPQAVQPVRIRARSRHLRRPGAQGPVHRLGGDRAGRADRAAGEHRHLRRAQLRDPAASLRARGAHVDRRRAGAHRRDDLSGEPDPVRLRRVGQPGDLDRVRPLAGQVRRLRTAAVVERGRGRLCGDRGVGGHGVFPDLARHRDPMADFRLAHGLSARAA